MEVDLSFLKNFKEWTADNDEWNEDLFSYLDSYNISSEEDKLCFWKKLLKTLELDYEILLTHKNSQFFFSKINISNGQYEDVCVALNKELNQHILDSKKWFLDDCEKNGFMETVRSEFIQRQLTYLKQEIEIFNQNMVFNYFYDSVATYLKVFINSIHSVLFSCKYGFQTHDEIPVNSSIFILLKHISRVQLLSHFLTWFHWKHDFT